MRARVRLWAALSAAGALAALPCAGSAQEIHPGEQRWLGLTGPDIPDVLKAVAANPYKAPAEPACETIPAELLALDKVLGADADTAQPKKSYVVSYAQRMAGGAVRGLVPYRGAIRFLTGADHKDHELMDAARAGWARRGFLRGLEANLNCAPPKVVAATAESAGEPAAATVSVASLEVAKVPTAYVEPPPHDLATIMLGEPADQGFPKPGR